MMGNEKQDTFDSIFDFEPDKAESHETKDTALPARDEELTPLNTNVSSLPNIQNREATSTTTMFYPSVIFNQSLSDTIALPQEDAFWGNKRGEIPQSDLTSEPKQGANPFDKKTPSSKFLGSSSGLSKALQSCSLPANTNAVPFNQPWQQTLPDIAEFEPSSPFNGNRRKYSGKLFSPKSAETTFMTTSAPAADGQRAKEPSM